MKPPLPGRRVRIGDPEAITRQAPEVPAREVGVDPRALEATWRSVVRYYRLGLQPAMALCVRVRGQVVLHRSIGHRVAAFRGEPPRPTAVATPDTPFNIFSASKAVTAMLIHLLDDEGKLHLDDPVAETIPEFGTLGKHRITIRHVLTHRAGLPSIPGDEVDLDLLARPDRILERLCAAPLQHPPGRVLAYHALTGGWILGEIVRRVSGMPVERFLEARVLEPLGFRWMRYGVRPEDVPRVARDERTGPRPRWPVSWMFRRAIGVPMDEAVTIARDPRFLTAVVPSGNIVATAEEACRFFELLLRGGELDGVRVFGARTVRRAVTEQSWMERDRMLGLPIRYGMGFMLGARRLSFYGHHTPRAFGHLGFTNVLCWADPDRELSACLVASGKPLFTAELAAWLDIPWSLARGLPRVPPRRGRPPYAPASGRSSTQA